MLVFERLYVCLCVLGQMVSVGVVSDKVCINPVMTVLAGRAAGGSSWCLPAKLLTYGPGLKETIVIYWWVGGTIVVSVSFSLSLSHRLLPFFFQYFEDRTLKNQKNRSAHLFWWHAAPLRIDFTWEVDFRLTWGWINDDRNDKTSG